MAELMDDSAGFFWDSSLGTYVTDCDQRALMQNLYIRFEDSSSFTGSNQWFVVTPSDYMTEIDQTDVCQVLLKMNTADEWILGLNFLN